MRSRDDRQRARCDAGVRDSRTVRRNGDLARLADGELRRVRKGLLARQLAFEDVAPSPLPLARLVWTSRWITPVGIPKRFDTYFFLTEVPAGTVAVADQTEGMEMRWLRPEAALAESRDGRLPLVFPTIRNLEALAGFTSTTALIDSRHGAEIRPTQPVITGDGDQRRIVLPEDE
jgi:hypothetical protein